MSTFNLFSPRNLGSALSVGGLAALMVAGPMRPDVVALSATCLLGSLAAFAAHACFGDRRRTAKAPKLIRSAPAAAAAAEWEDADSWEVPPARDAQRSWDAARALSQNRWKMPPSHLADAVHNVHPALLTPVLPLPAQAAVTAEREHRNALADLQNRRSS